MHERVRCGEGSGSVRTLARNNHDVERHGFAELEGSPSEIDRPAPEGAGERVVENRMDKRISIYLNAGQFS